MALTDLQTAAGAALAVTASAPATENLAGFAALAYTNISAIQSLGDFGDTYADVPFTPLETRRTLHFKGSVDGGTLALELGFDPVDAGQAAIEAALASDNAYSFKVTLQDGTIFYFAGRVMAAPLSVGTTDSVVMRNTTIQLTTAVYTA